MGLLTHSLSSYWLVKKNWSEKTVKLVRTLNKEIDIDRGLISLTHLAREDILHVDTLWKLQIGKESSSLKWISSLIVKGSVWKRPIGFESLTNWKWLVTLRITHFLVDFNYHLDLRRLYILEKIGEDSHWSNFSYITFHSFIFIHFWQPNNDELSSLNKLAFTVIIRNWRGRTLRGKSERKFNHRS